MQGSVSGVLEKHTDVFGKDWVYAEGNHCQELCRERRTTQVFQIKISSVRPERKIEEELDRLAQTKVIEPVCYSEWVTSIVPVLNAYGKVRVCEDYKLTVNRVSHLEQYPFPTLDDLCEKLTEGKQFTKLDLSHAYSQLPLDEKSKEYVSINTHTKGCFGTTDCRMASVRHQLCSRRPYLAGHTACRRDIILTGATKAYRLEEAGLRLG